MASIGLEAAHPRLALAGPVDGDARLALPKRAAAVNVRCAPQFIAFSTGGEQRLRACCDAMSGITGGQTRRSRLTLVGRRLGSGKKVLLTTNYAISPLI